MKRNILFGCLIMILVMMFAACNKDEQAIISDGETESLAASEDLLSLQDAIEDTEDEIDLLETRGEDEEGNCPTITIIPNNSFPARILTVDYGEGCEGRNGRLRSGKVIIEYTGALYQEGSERRVRYEDFSIDGAKIEGSRILANAGQDDQGNRSFTHSVTMSITYPDGSQATWTASHLRQQIAGGNTIQPFDDAFATTGQAEGVNRNGQPFTSTIIQALIKRRSCRWIEAGIQQLTVDDRTLTINYGDGGCDGEALVTLPDGRTRRVRIEAWWRR